MFVKLNYSHWSFYYTKWIFEGIGYVASLLGSYFLSQYIGAGSMVEEYGSNYTAFLLLGIIYIHFFNYLLDQPYGRLHSAYRGSLQMYLLSPVGVWPYILGSIIWVMVYWSTMWLLLTLVIGKLALGLTLYFPSDPIALLLVFTFSVISIIGLSFIDASTFSLLNAKGGQNPVRFFIVSTGLGSTVLSGALFPISLFPTWLQSIGKMLPHFYALRSLRLILLANATISNPVVLNDIFMLAIFSVALIPLGVVLFEIGLRKSKKDGNLIWWV